MAGADVISFKGLDPARVLNALYHGTQPLGMGFLHDKPGLTAEQSELDLAFSIEKQGRRPYFDYYRGRPLKLQLDLDAEEFDPGLYDRDAGKGAAARVIAKLREVA